MPVGAHELSNVVVGLQVFQITGWFTTANSGLVNKGHHTVWTARILTFFKHRHLEVHWQNKLQKGVGSQTTAI
jgi:hypothetical protein